ncbi:hypothetical protein Y024_5865 [Burkholderia pseudomallei TSV44]|nr:hypothetical protein Y024_5865 [Burkholderia pseudomallei TSV44]
MRVRAYGIRRPIRSHATLSHRWRAFNRAGPRTAAIPARAPPAPAFAAFRRYMFRMTDRIRHAARGGAFVERMSHDIEARTSGPLLSGKQFTTNRDFSGARRCVDLGHRFERRRACRVEPKRIRSRTS